MIKNYQTAIVTGASHGIGPFIVRVLAKEGMNLVLAAHSGQELEQVATAALRPISGRDAVARFSLGTRRFLPEDYRVELAEVNGQPALIIRAGGQAVLVLSIEVEAEHIQAVRIIANPEKLARV